jgi:hypothetical protein
VDNDLGVSSIHGDYSGHTDATGFGKITHCGSITAPNDNGEGLFREGTIKINEGRLPIGSFCSVLADYNAAYSGLLANVIGCFAGLNLG